MANEVPLNQEPKWCSPIPQPTIGAGGSASFIYSTYIAASPATPSENAAQSAPAALGHLISNPEQSLFLGTEFAFHVQMDPEKQDKSQKSDMVVTVLDEFERDGRRGLRIAWKTRGDAWYSRAERTQEFLEGPEGGSEYYCFETFYGPATWLVKVLFGSKMVRGFGWWKNGLKKAAEEKAGDGTQ